MPVIDTSALVALFDADHPKHAQAREAIRGPLILYVTGGVLGEFTTVLRRRANDVGLDGSRVAREALERLEALAGYRPAPECDAEAVSRTFRANTALSYVDAWGIVLALELADTLLTFDDRQASAMARASAAE